MDPEQQEIQAAMRELSMLLSQQTSLLGGTVKSLADTIPALKNGTQAQTANTQAEKENNNVIDRFAEANTKAASIVNEKSQIYKEAFGTGVSALMGFKNAVLSSQEGLVKYSNVIDTLGTGAYNIGQNFGFLGTAAGGILSVFGKVVNELLKVTDGVVGIRDNFTKTSGIIPITMTEIGKLAANARFSLDNMATLGREMENLGGKMIGLGGYAGEGAVKFMKIAAVSDNVRREFGRMGINQDALLHLQAKYVETQAISGNAYVNQSKSIEQIQKESLVYAKNMTVLSSLTGKSADALQEEINQVQLVFEEQVATMAENAKIRKLQDEGRHSEAAALKLEQDNRKKMIETYTALYGPDKANQMARVMRTGYYDSLTSGLAMLQMRGGSDPLSFTQGLKTSANAQADLLAYSEKLDSAISANAEAFSVAFEVLGSEFGKKVGAEEQVVGAMMRRQGIDVSKDFARILAEATAKSEEDTDTLANSVETARSVEREVQGKVQNALLDVQSALLEGPDSIKAFIDKFLNKNLLLMGAVSAAAIALGTIVAAKGLQALLGRGGAAAGAAASVAEIAEDQLLDKNGRPLRGGARSARIAKLTGGGPAQVGKPGGFGASLQSVASALSNAGKAGPQVILGAAALATAIASFGAGIAGAVAVIGKALPSLANGLKAFNDLDGKNLQQAGLGMAGLGIGILAMGAGTMAQAFGTIIRFFTGDKDPLTQASEMLFRLQAVNLDRKKIEDNGASLMAYAKAMAAVAALGAGAGIADAMRSYYDGIGKLFGATPPYKDLEKFSQLQVDPAKVKINSDSFVEFSRAMASYSGYGDGLSVITSSLAQATVSFFNTNPPEKQVVEFSKLKIDPKQTSINATGFVEFSRAMAAYKGGVGLREAVSIIAGAKLSMLFGMDGPIKSFENFAAINVGPKAAENSQAFLNFSKAMGVLSGGSGGGWFNNLVSNLREPVARTVARTVDSGRELVTQVGTAVGDFARGLFTRPGPDSTALNFIGRIESGNNYNKLVGGRVKNDPPLTSMTVGQVMAYQDTMRDNGHESTALGKYQIIKGTLGGIVRSGTVNPNDQFSETTQDKAAVYLMNVRGRERFRSGRLGVDQYANNLAKEWASLPMPNGRSYYAGVGSNNSLTSRSDFVRSLQARDGGIMSGPSTGYPIELHGTELIIPIDSNSILSKLASTSAEAVAKDLQRKSVKAVPKPTSTTGIPKKTVGISKEMIYALSAKFDSVVNKIESTDQVQKKLLKQVL